MQLVASMGKALHPASANGSVLITTHKAELCIFIPFQTELEYILECMYSPKRFVWGD